MIAARDTIYTKISFTELVKGLLLLILRNFYPGTSISTDSLRESPRGEASRDSD